MSKELFVSSTPHETKVAIVEEDQLSEIYYERENEYTLAGSIYKGRVTRVLPGMQSAFVNIGLERDAFLYVSDFLLEEEEEVDGLDQVVSRARIVEAPGPAPTEEHQRPLEAAEMMPPGERAGEADVREEPAELPAAEGAGTPESAEEQDREGARKWRGRRRRRGRGRFQERDDRGGDRPADRSADRPPDRHSDRSVEREDVAPSRPHPPAEAPSAAESPVLLPGESISKYQPRAAAKAAARG